MPNKSIDTPITSCIRPKEKWNAAAHSPSCCGDSCSSPASGGPMIAATVRKAWLSVKPQVSASRMAQATRGGRGAAGAGVVEGGGSDGTRGSVVRRQRVGSRAGAPAPTRGALNENGLQRPSIKRKQLLKNE